MRILVVSPHPDDETLGAGGTILKMKDNGHQVYWLNITDILPDNGWSDTQIKHRQDQIRQIRQFYRFEDFYNLKLPTTKLKSLEEGTIISEIKKVYDKVRPEWIMIPGQYDAHSDHRVVYNCCMAAAKSFRAPYIKRITTMEILSETDYGFQNEKFVPNMFVDITDYLDAKINAMKIYDTEVEEVPFPRSFENIESLASVRGGCCSIRYAEAFCVLKQVE